ncbi:NADP-dependent phosphogluconate dehydrogenase [Aquimarina megaterium]|uniref:NADP-dependent phosphogluconate dehydrogenase n=1 Tax=Aquimarina megaterium TaxID=1443666 RepID=UPI0004B128F4|nr:NADP-dependent phosphogluconate dehydrogenase [Aquimarina megaterium]
MGLKNIYIVFGVSGCGKTTLGKELATTLGIPFYDADDFHPEENIKKMSDGIPLNDHDRAPWLQILADHIVDWSNDKGAVLACSALKQKYRDVLQSVGHSYINWIFLEASYELILNRLEARQGHFFKKELLVSQFETLERPEHGIFIDAEQSIINSITQIKLELNISKSQLGLIGLGVMGKSLAKNMLSRGFSLSVYNRQVENREVDIAKHFVNEQSNDTNVLGFDDLLSFVNSLEQPRTIMIMVNAGKPIDMVIESILPLLSREDCLIDGGNSHYKKTLEREQLVSKSGIHFLGTGVSGGEEGALKGPSIMPGGSKEAYMRSGKFLEAIAARDKNNNPCCTYIGTQGSGHYVKMIHNGIEYAEMQLLSEIYHFLRFYGNKNPKQISDVFESWRMNKKDSFLLEITVDILRKMEGEEFLIDKILDKAGQKGTGGWSAVSALEIGMPISTISEAVMARNLSGMKSERVHASEIYKLKPSTGFNDEELLATLEKAFYATSIINHAIGFDLISQASQEYQWNLNLSEIARIWTNGCIIRSDIMEKISTLFKDSNPISLLLFPEIVEMMKINITKLTDTVSMAMKAGYPLPVMSAATNYFLIYTSAQSSANMIQAQRDYFGAHTYQRVDAPITEYFHTNWKS